MTDVIDDDPDRRGRTGIGDGDGGWFDWLCRWLGDITFGRCWWPGRMLQLQPARPQLIVMGVVLPSRLRSGQLKREGHQRLVSTLLLRGIRLATTAEQHEQTTGQQAAAGRRPPPGDHRARVILSPLSRFRAWFN